MYGTELDTLLTLEDLWWFGPFQFPSPLSPPFPFYVTFDTHVVIRVFIFFLEKLYLAVTCELPVTCVLPLFVLLCIRCNFILPKLCIWFGEEFWILD